MKITDKTALKAAETIREYCRSKPITCEGCVFDIARAFSVIDHGCLFDDPNHLPETWELERIRAVDEPLDE